MPFVLIVASCAIAERRCDGERGSAEARCHSWSLRQRRHCRRGGASLSPRVVAIETETVTAKARHCCWVVTGGSHRCQCRHRSYHCSVPVFFLSTVLKSYGHIDVHQEQPYGDIRLNLQRIILRMIMKIKLFIIVVYGLRWSNVENGYMYGRLITFIRRYLYRI
ncbi:uncharacterized protein LOC127740655 isoform X1 [Arachis duranensis]|uniref:Uncharacterized protein LOC127740655 isoform X1 n=1 Tax=Arachis duranensis TaxID=130453 RepID=A0A9C6TCS7_ARADU|nr:uncharacterized protein LOC127740655 isoform X1 [Arachis duranensis]